jgi:RNA polymerase sigma-70 factor (ECF subfamily)
MNAGRYDFEEVHSAYRGRIERHLARIVGEAEAEDLTQEVFLRIHRSLPGFRGDSSLSTWIYRIATNAALDRLRSQKRCGAAECLPLTDDFPTEEIRPADPITDSPTPMSSPEQLAFRKQRFACYCDVLNSLPSTYRPVLVLSEIGDLAVGEISARLGLNPSTVKIRLHRGREKLLAALRSHCRPEDWL